MSASSASSTTSPIQTFFIENAEVLDLIKSLSSSLTTPSPSLPPPFNDAIVKRIKTIFDKYLESPTLLDMHLEIMMTLLVHPCSIVINKFYGGASSTSSSFPSPSDEQLLSILHSNLDVISSLCKVRGYKTVKKFFTHEASDLEPTLACLHASNPLDHTTWSSRYALLLWLSMLALVPFDICSIDSTDEHAQQNSSNLVQQIIDISISYLNDAGPTREAAAVCLAGVLTRPDMERGYLQNFMGYAKTVLQERVDSKQSNMSHLSDNTFLTMGIVSTLALLFKTGHREKFLNFVDDFMESIILIAERSSSQTLLRKMLVKLFQRIGTTFMPPRVVMWRYQRGQRSLLSNMAKSSSSSSTSASASASTTSSSALPPPPPSNSSSISISTSTTLVESECEPEIHVPPELEDVVDQLLTGLRDRDTIVRWSAAKGLGRITERLPRECADDVVEAILDLFNDNETDSAWHGSCLALAELSRRGLLLPFRLPRAVPIIVKAIHYDVRRGMNSVGAHVRDAACYVCWAFARAYSPDVMAPHVDALSKAMLLAALFDREINCRRAASAAFQENVGRQGNENFQHGIDILTAADYFTLGNRASAYTDIARFVATFEKYRLSIIDHVRSIKLFHWDVQIRELASVSLGHLASLNVEYMADVVLTDLINMVCDSDLLIRHGAVIGIAEITLALSKSGSAGSSGVDKLTQKIYNVVLTVEKARLYRGKGGELMRGGICRLTECIALSRLPLKAVQQVRLLDSIDECIKHPMESVQLSAVAALRAVSRSYFPVSSTGPSTRLYNRVVQKYVDIIQNEDNPAATRGFSLALGCLPSKLISFNITTLSRVVNTLCDAAAVDCKVGLEPDAETRRNCLLALTDIVTTVSVGKNGVQAIEGADGVCFTVGLNVELVGVVFDCISRCIGDYSADKRGDVGSWVRTVGLSALETLVVASVAGSEDIVHVYDDCEEEEEDMIMIPTASQRSKDVETEVLLKVNESIAKSRQIANREFGGEKVNYFNEEICRQVFCLILKQLSEKLDSTREVAGNVLHRLLESRSVRIPYIEDRGFLTAAFSAGGAKTATVNWASPSTTFPMIMKALNINAYHNSIVSGLIISVGGLTESVVKNSSSALLEWGRAMKRAGGHSHLARLGTTMLDLFEGVEGERVVLPLLKTLHVLLSHDVLFSEGDKVVVVEEEEGKEKVNSIRDEFFINLISKLKREAANSKSYKKNIAVAQVLIDLINLDNALNPAILSSVMTFVLTLLGHPFPKVRKFVAEQFYLCLLDDEGVVEREEDYEECCQLLLETNWEGEIEVDEVTRGLNDKAVGVRVARNNLADLIGHGVVLSAKTREKKVTRRVGHGGGGGGGGGRKKDELESYMSLVKEAGR